MKAQQWCVFNMYAATQTLDRNQNSPNLELKTWFWDSNECENTHTLTTKTTVSKSSQKEVNNQTDLQNSVLCPPKVPSLQVLGLD